MERCTKATIYKDNLEYNLKQIRKYVKKNVKLCVAVKADGYGHNAVLTAQLAEKVGAGFVAVATVEEAGMYKQIKTKFIEGSAGFMALVAIALVLGLAFCIERIIYLSLSDVNVKKMIEGVESKVEAGDIEGAKDIARNTRGPIASIFYQGLTRIDEGIDSVEKSAVAYGAVQASNLEKGCSWITLFIGIAPSLGFLGTVIGMVQAFDDIQKAGDISPTVVAGGMKVALLTTLFGIIVALVLQVFYNYVLSKIESLTALMEDSTISLLDICTKYNVKKNK